MRSQIKRGLYALVASLGLLGMASAEEPRLFSLPPVEEGTTAEPANIEKTAATEGLGESVEISAIPEVFRERYPNRAVKVERHVVLDAQLNYVNHGPWAWFDERGQVLARGEYRMGKRTGTWARVHTVDKNTIFALPLYRGFEKPLTSTAILEDGELNGIWTVTDAKGRKASQCHFDKGKQHGQATWWHPNGQIQRTAHYKDGLIEGELREFNNRGELIVKETYMDGCRLDTEVNNYSKGKKRSERSVLIPVALQHYSWFDASVTLDKIDRPKVYHGPQVWWHPDGQKEMVGQYERGVPNGTFTWWHANGQEHITGQYSDGKQEGKWIWWHPNGQKEMEGEYQQGLRVGKWAAWTHDGKIRLAEEHPAGVQVPTMATAPKLQQ